jgi:hypothetical protein
MKLLCVALLAVMPFVGFPACSQEPATVKAVVPPRYPPLAAVTGIFGVVEVEVVVGKNGNVESIYSSRTLGQFKQLIGNAELYAKKWVFTGASTSPLKIIFDYQILPPDTSEQDLATEFIPPRKVIIKSTLHKVIDNQSGH